MKGFGLCFGAVGMLVLTVICSRLLMVPTVSADSAAAQASVTVMSSCEMTSDIDTAHASDIAPGIYRNNIGETTITTSCNDANGYAIYAIGYTNNEFGRNDMLGQSSGRTIATGTAESGNVSNWAMQLTAVNNSVAPTIATGYDSYHAVPDEYTKVSSFANSTLTNPEGSKFKITFAAFISGKQAADTYIGKVKYTLVHPSDTTETPCVGTYTINYDRNGGTGSMDSQTACVDRAIGILPSGFTPPTPVEENQFAVWNTEADGSGYAYTAGRSVTNLVSAGGSVTLYAQWAPKYMQDITASTCAIAASESPITVYDRRDGSDYTIRYIEGACWMTQNLRITGTVYAQNSNFNTYDNVNVCESDLVVGNSNTEPRCHDSGNTVNGVWYNYAAATARTISGSSNSTVATEDICPVNWHLPSYDGDKAAGSINSLSYTSITSVFKLLPITGGHYVDGSLVGEVVGRWWSNASFNSSSRRYLYYNGSDLGMNQDSRTYGIYIRCVRTE